MEWDPTERDAWVADAQRWIGQINGVLHSKIDLDSAGDVTGVHVVSGMDREPRHIVRDVEGLLKARLGLDVYYKKIGVVQVVENGTVEPVAEPAPEPDAPVETPPPTPVEPTPDPATETAAPAPEPEMEPLREPVPAVLVAEDLAMRLRCVGVGVMASDAVVRAEVQLQCGEAEACGTCEGPNHAGSDVALVARATLEALGQLLDDPVLLHLRDVRLEEVGDHPVIVTAVDLVEGRRTETLFGTCAAGHNRQQAIVHAVLDALNRRLALLALKRSAAES